ncbi:sensor histidine kinase [Cellulomonas sp. S1-8]|uniref:sensor histidine kinase n=1 Tax=Cellulomonas sp. S1-8 TaxID=2904790 RepID=UPI0022446369|nr:histidine kinase [Cellulomonas sp. S1-8]UZN02590.1 histidine kinase [Cellulomonas sp. S1-8]
MRRRAPWAATGRSVLLVLLWAPCALLVVATVVSLALVAVAVGLPMLQAVLTAVHGVARAHRRLAEGATGRPVPLLSLRTDDPHPTRPDWFSRLHTDALHVAGTALGATPDTVGLMATGVEPLRPGWRRLQQTDTWRLLGWLGVAATGGALISAAVVLLPLVAIAAVVLAIVLPATVDLAVPGVLALAAGAVLAGGTWWRYGDALGRVRADVDAALLSPGRQELLEQRVQDLAASRRQTVDDAAGELRRIERDLHDGAQARLVSLGLTLGMVAELLDADPRAARELLQEARGTTLAALRDLRAVVQGIHPPVLADRGLSGGIEALALDLAVPVTLTDRLPGRPPAPVESAVYFAVAESLANVVKHASAARASVRLDAHDGTLRVEVADDGAGGADPARGSGLRGVAARLQAFDGTMMVVSPPGGPTVITLEVPCAWSSPKTSPSSATA